MAQTEDGEPTVTHAVFYRFLNLGHVGSPTRDLLEQALLEAGATRARSFQTNGTVLLEAGDPEAVVDRAAPILEDTSGYRGAAFVQPVTLVRALLEDSPFEMAGEDETSRAMITFFGGGSDASWALPWTSARKDVEIFAVRHGIALSIVRTPKNTSGNPTSEIERATGGMATTRTLGTIERLLRAADAWMPDPEPVRRLE